jgi:hypothetical protein
MARLRMIYGNRKLKMPGAELVSQDRDRGL